MTYFDDKTVLLGTAPILGILLKNKISGDSLRTRGMLMPITDSAKFIKGIKGRKAIKAVETQRDVAVKAMSDLSNAKKKISIKSPISSTKKFINQIKTTSDEWNKLDKMHEAQLKYHNVTNLKNFSEELKGGVSSIAGIASGTIATTSLAAQNKNKRKGAN